MHEASYASTTRLGHTRMSCLRIDMMREVGLRAVGCAVVARMLVRLRLQGPAIMHVTIANMSAVSSRVKAVHRNKGQVGVGLSIGGKQVQQKLEHIGLVKGRLYLRSIRPHAHTAPRRLHTGPPGRGAHQLPVAQHTGTPWCRHSQCDAGVLDSMCRALDLAGSEVGDGWQVERQVMQSRPPC